ncbi:MAG: efflux RND transporter periplasmic adaptor subunit [Bacteroidales bacterium]
MNTRFLLVLMMTIFLFGCTEKKEETIDQRIPIEVMKVRGKLFANPIRLSGRLTSENEIKLSFKTGGIISGIYVDEGQYVKKGTPLASLNLREIGLYFDQTVNGEQKAKRDLDRAKGLFQDSIISLELMQNAQTAYDVAKSNMEIAQYNLKHSKIYAPFDGWILKQIAFPKELIGEGYPVFLFGQKGENWKLKLGVPDREVFRVRIGDSASVYFSAFPDKQFSAKVSEIGSFADPYTAMFELSLNLDPANNPFATGILGTAQIFPEAKTKYYFLPPSAVFDISGKKAYVFELIKDSLYRKSVHIGGILDSCLMISKGLNSESIVVVKGASYLKSNKAFKIVSNK